MPDKGFWLAVVLLDKVVDGRQGIARSLDRKGFCLS
jgi:hypothetical protein